MARQRKPASLKQGNSENKEELKRREELEKQLMGNDDNVRNIPEHLTEEEKIYYRWLVNEIEIAGVICNLDIPLLEQTANCLHIMRLCDDNIRKNGILVQRIDRFGNIEDKENPAIKVKLNYQTKYATLCNQLGLSPASRANLAGLQAKVSEEEKDPLLQILKEGI